MGAEQKVSCPICNAMVEYSAINGHLDRCTGGRGDGKRPATVQGMLEGRKNKKIRLENNSIDLKNDYEFRRLLKSSHMPLSEKVRPQELKDYVGQQHFLSHEDGALYKYIAQGVVPSMVLWGPPGVGKTTLARIITKYASAADSENKVKYSLIETSGTKANTSELREIFSNARKKLQTGGSHTVLFIDEIHRFNKAQQDLLLPHVENGDIVLIGATTENPSFQLNNALISRCHIFVLEQLSTNESCIVLSRGIALLNKYRKLVWKCDIPLKIPREVMEYIVNIAMGDTRRALNLLEMIEMASRTVDKEIDSDFVKDIIKKNSNSLGLNTYYDANTENHYDTISALHKAIRGGDENAALLYMARMLQGGEDPLYISRRFIRMASEDIGVADNTMLPLAVATHDAVQKIGMPEADVILAHCCTALARAKKSVEVYRGYQKIKALLKDNVYSMASSQIPMHIRNAPTELMKELGYHKGYKYNPDYKDGLVAQEYFPQEVLDKCPDKNELRFLNGKHLGDKIDPDLS